MYPDCDSRPIDLSPFEAMEGVVDAVYNPLCTNLVLDARERGIKAEGGLYMLVMQAVAAVEKFLDREIDRGVAIDVYRSVLLSKENIVLTGMPGSGKSTVGALLSLEGYTFSDSDEEIERRAGCPIKELIALKGETYFRDLESEVIGDLSAKSATILATGGGAILREKNVRALKRNGRLFFLDAPLSRLEATDTRPLSNTREKLTRLFAERESIYRSTADLTVPATGTPEEAAEFILSKRTEVPV